MQPVLKNLQLLLCLNWPCLGLSQKSSPKKLHACVVKLADFLSADKICRVSLALHRPDECHTDIIQQYEAVPQV